jgi:hypothetical protein
MWSIVDRNVSFCSTYLYLAYHYPCVHKVHQYLGHVIVSRSISAESLKSVTEVNDVLEAVRMIVASVAGMVPEAGVGTIL